MMKINQELNIKLKQDLTYFEQYLSLINNEDLSISTAYESDAERAKLDFLNFYLDSVLKTIKIHAKDSNIIADLHEQVSAIKLLIKKDNPDTKLCIKKMEDTSNYWSTLCY